MSEENINTTQETGPVNDVETRQEEDKKCTCKLACVLEIITVLLPSFVRATSTILSTPECHTNSLLPFGLYKII